MTRKITARGDLLILRKTTSRGIWIQPHEQGEIMSAVGDSAFALYYLLRTYPFKEAEQIEDDNLANMLGWTARKTQKYRLILEKAELIHSIRYGTNADGITKLFVGADTVALFHAGLPADILNPIALGKIKRKLGIKNSQEMTKRIIDIVTEYENNSQDYL